MRLLFCAMTVVALFGCTSAKKNWAQIDKQQWAEFKRMPAQATAGQLPVKVVPSSGYVNINVPDEVPKEGLYGKVCGELNYTESGRQALDSDEAFYYLRMNCQSIGREVNEPHVLVIKRNAFRNNQQRSWMTRWRGEVVRRGGGRNMVPYICVQGEVSAPLCENDQSVVLKTAVNFTGKEDVFSAWGVEP